MARTSASVANVPTSTARNRGLALASKATVSIVLTLATGRSLSTVAIAARTAGRSASAGPAVGRTLSDAVNQAPCASGTQSCGTGSRSPGKVFTCRTTPTICRVTDPGLPMFGMVSRTLSGSRSPMNRRTNSSLTMHTGTPAIVSPAEKFRPRRSGMSNVERYVGLMIWYADAVRAG